MSRTRIGLVAAIALAVAVPAHAQIEANLGALSGDNAKGYLQPLQDALSGTMNSAIFQSGNVPKVGFGLQLGVKLMGVTFADEDKIYTPTNPPGYSTVEASTVVGSETSVASTGPGGATIYHPGGFALDEFALAVPQLTIGSVAGTRAVVRYIALDLGDAELGDFSLFGIGAQHSISQYFAVLPIDLAAGVFYQSFQVGKDDLVKVSALAFHVMGSKKFGMLEPYVGVGFDNLSMEANYTNTQSGQSVNVDFDSATDLHLTGGVSLVLPVVRLHAEGNIAATNGVAVGLTFGL
jgi:hypothetical protein